MACRKEGRTVGVQEMAQEQGRNTGADASGNPILKDIGLLLRGVFRKEIDVCRCSVPPLPPFPSLPHRPSQGPELCRFCD